MRAPQLLLMLAMACGMPSGAQVTNRLLSNSFETSADLLRFARNNCSVSSSTDGVTDGQKSALVVFSNVDRPSLYFKVGTVLPMATGEAGVLWRWTYSIPTRPV
jgi:hypothetical protein